MRASIGKHDIELTTARPHQPTPTTLQSQTPARACEHAARGIVARAAGVTPPYDERGSARGDWATDSTGRVT
jgi:hypothetical protein